MTLIFVAMIIECASFIIHNDLLTIWFQRQAFVKFAAVLNVLTNYQDLYQDLYMFHIHRSTDLSNLCRHQG